MLDAFKNRPSVTSNDAPTFPTKGLGGKTQTALCPALRPARGSQTPGTNPDMTAPAGGCSGGWGGAGLCRPLRRRFHRHQGLRAGRDTTPVAAAAAVGDVAVFERP